jgi:NAD+ synthase (glutamine-hydrolysing)
MLWAMPTLQTSDSIYKIMKIALAQLNPTIGDLKGNADRILKTAQEVAAQGVKLLLTPELSLCGYPPRDLLLDANFIAEMGQRFCRVGTAHIFALK